MISSEPDVPPSVAVTVQAPALRAVRTPEALTDAIAESELVHVTSVVRVAVLLSLYVPLAVSCRNEPAVIKFVEDEMVIDDKVGVEWRVCFERK